MKGDVCTHASLWLHMQAPQQLQPLFLSSISLISFHSQVYEIWTFKKYRSFHICSTITMLNNPLGIHHTLSCFTQKKFMYSVLKPKMTNETKWNMPPKLIIYISDTSMNWTKKVKIAIETKINFYHSSVIRIKYPPI